MDSHAKTALDIPANEHRSRVELPFVGPMLRDVQSDRNRKVRPTESDLGREELSTSAEHEKAFKTPQRLH